MRRRSLRINATYFEQAMLLAAAVVWLLWFLWMLVG